MAVDRVSLSSDDGGPVLTGLPLPFGCCEDNLGNASWLAADLDEWITASGVGLAVASQPRARASGYALLSCLNYPAASPELLRLISRYFAFYFECDTSRIEFPALAGEPADAAAEILCCSATIQDPQRPLPTSAGRHVEALRSITEQLQRFATPEQAERARRGEQNYFVGAACEAAYLAQGTVPTSAEYQCLREHTVTADWHLALVEITGGFEVPGDTRWRSDVRAAVRTMGGLLGLINDLASWRKEARMSPQALNYPVVISRELGCTLFEAVCETADRMSAHAQRFSEQTGRLIRKGGTLGRWAAGARHCVAGWHRWHARSERFSLDTADRDRLP
ncbi:terpene synthase family protein [Amycolatopsis sp. cmx-11-12]|uniref:terpene synthase family protein n=1 Tax=Amycolatopsis sp. cmx-11-12 TaxID=2785795 RepID=UPI00391841EC